VTLEIEVSRPRCIASKACINAAEGVFAIVDGASLVVNADGADEADIVAAAEACPTGAITLRRNGERLA